MVTMTCALPDMKCIEAACRQLSVHGPASYVKCWNERLNDHKELCFARRRVQRVPDHVGAHASGEQHEETPQHSSHALLTLCKPIACITSQVVSR